MLSNAPSCSRETPILSCYGLNTSYTNSDFPVLSFLSVPACNFRDFLLERHTPSHLSSSLIPPSYIFHPFILALPSFIFRAYLEHLFYLVYLSYFVYRLHPLHLSRFVHTFHLQLVPSNRITSLHTHLVHRSRSKEASLCPLHVGSENLAHQIHVGLRNQRTVCLPMNLFPKLTQLFRVLVKVRAARHLKCNGSNRKSRLTSLVSLLMFSVPMAF